MNIFIYDQQQQKNTWDFDNFCFSGGEEHVRLQPIDAANINKVEIVTRLDSSAAVMRVLLVVDAIKRIVPANTQIELEAPYLPYARQDRVCVNGEAFSLAVMANLLNSLALNKIKVWDAHSKVANNLINNLEVVGQSQLVGKSHQLVDLILDDNCRLISPDAGAANKTVELAQQLNKDQKHILQASKKRCPITGNILATELVGDVQGKDAVITDDICDGGRTFIELAKVLKEKGARTVTLYVTHGIFSKGFDVFTGYIDRIFTTDSIARANNAQLNVIKLLGE